MTYSLNETHKLVKDAARGADWTWGDADELARLAVWLEVAGAAGLAYAADALESDGAEIRDLFSARDAVMVRGNHETLSPPLPLVAVLSALAQDIGQALRINDAPTGQYAAYVSPDGEVLCCPNLISLSTSLSEGTPSKWTVILTTEQPSTNLLPVMSQKIRSAAVQTGLDHDAAAHQRLEAHARKTLVEATAASRLRGAGAGTVDRD
ncbi:MAG: DUF3726 domain-containing protein [Pseudomonadota bacterium]